MYKTKFGTFILLLCLAFYPLLVQCQSSIELRGAVFFPSSKLFRDIYGTVEGSYQLEASTRLSDYLDGWANFDWCSEHGKSIGLNDPTRVSIANFSLGIKFPYRLSRRFTVYAGIGPSLSGIWIKNDCPCGQEKVSKLAIGGVLKTGIIYFFNKQLFIDMFADYLYQPVSFQNHVDIGGVKIGVGIGVRL